MTTFELANYPTGTTTWEVYLDGKAIERNISQRQIVANGNTGELVITLYQETTPTWRWVGHLPANISSTQRVRVNPQEGKICLIETKVQAKGINISDVLKVGAVLGVVAVVLGSSRQ